MFDIPLLNNLFISFLNLFISLIELEKLPLKNKKKKKKNRCKFNLDKITYSKHSLEQRMTFSKMNHYCILKVFSILKRTKFTFRNLNIATNKVLASAKRGSWKKSFFPIQPK